MLIDVFLYILQQLLFGVVSNMASSNIQQKLENRFGKLACGRMYSRKRIVDSPSLLMEDRGEEAGFRRDLYLKRTVDDELRRIFAKGAAGRNHIAIITGRYVSGKTRAIIELLKNPEISPDINNVLVVEREHEVSEYLSIIKHLRRSTLVLFDDVESFWEVNDEKSITPDSFQRILAAINDRALPCIITISKDAPQCQELLHLSQTDAAKGRRKLSGISIVEIEDILYEDEVHLWCSKNFKNSLYAKAIGGYIPELSRHFEVNIDRIMASEEATLFLIAYIVLEKYRNKKSSFFESINRLYDVINEADSLRLEPIRDVYDDRISVLFKTGMLHLASDETIHFDDRSLLASFKDRCVKHKSGNDTAEKYLVGTEEAEYNQLLRLIEMDYEDPVYYSRGISKCQYKSHVVDVSGWFVETFFDCREKETERPIPLTIKSKYSANTETMREICFTVSLIVGRAQDPIQRCKEYISASIIPNIGVVDELIRAAINVRMPDRKKELFKYAIELKEKYKLKEDLYYYCVLEAYDKGYNDERVKEVIALYHQGVDPALVAVDESSGLQFEKTFADYCKRLVIKATTEEKIDRLFRILTNHEEILVDRKFFIELIRSIHGKYHVRLASIVYKKLAGTLISNSPAYIPLEICNSAIIEILFFCNDAAVSMWIYDNAIQHINNQLNPADEDAYRLAVKARGVMTLKLATKMSGLTYTDDLYWPIRDIIENCIKDAHENKDFGAEKKFYNSLLFNQPRGQVDTLEVCKDIYQNTTLCPLARDINSLNSLFDACVRSLIKVYLEVTDKIARWKQLVNDVEGLRNHLKGDGRYYLFMYQVMDNILHLDSDADISFIRDIIDQSVVMENDRLLGKEVKMSNDIKTINDIARKCHSQMDLGNIQMDVINQLISQFCDSFADNRELKQWLISLVDGSFDAISHKCHDYYHYFNFFVTVGRIHNVEGVLDYLNKAWSALQHWDFPLRLSNGGDLLCVAINSPKLNLDEALQVFEFAVGYERDCCYRPYKIIDLDAVQMLAAKFSVQAREHDYDANDLMGFAKQIQKIIYSLPEIEYSDKDSTFKKVKNPIQGTLKGWGLNYVLWIPIESPNTSIRHDTFLSRTDSDGVFRGNAYEMSAFIYQEIFSINKEILKDIRSNVSTPHDMSEQIEFLILALQSVLDEKMDVKLAEINEARFRAFFRQVYSNKLGATGSKWFSYANFFQGYLNEGYVPERFIDQWKSLADRFNFHIISIGNND